MTTRHEVKTCLHKKRYDTEGDALAEAAYRVGRGAPTLRAYRCRVCKGYHLTSKEKR